MKINSLFSLKKRPENGIYYLGFRSEGGRMQWISTKCRRKSDAIDFVRSYSTKEDEQPIKSLILSQLLTEFLSCQSVSNSTSFLYSHAIQKLIGVCGDKDISLYVANDFERFKNSLGSVLKANSINAYSRSIIALFSFAHKRKYIKEKPFSFSQLVKTVKQPPMFLTVAEFETLIAVINNKTLKDFYTVLSYTGMRLGELVNSKWKNVSLEKKQIAIVNDGDFKTKTGKSRLMPMNDLVYNIISNTEKKSDFVFCKYDGFRFHQNYISHYFKKCVRKAGLNDKYHVHTLRHSFASWLVQKDIPIFTVQNLLGHSSVNTTLIYSHLSTSALHSAVNIL